MENRREFMKMLAETSTNLDEIKKQQKEINSALDLIEERKNQQTVKAVPVNSAFNVLDTHEEHDTSVHHVGAAHDELPDSRVKITIDSKIKPKSQQESDTRTENVSENVFQQTDKRPRAGSTNDKDSTPKGILRKPEKGTKQSYGFKERLNLNVGHVMYGSQLRRTAVEMHRDNRLCLKFGLLPNEGSVYESKRHFPAAKAKPSSLESKHNHQEPKRKTEGTSKANDRLNTYQTIARQEVEANEATTEETGDLKVVNNGEVSREAWIGVLEDGLAEMGLDKGGIKEICKGFFDEVLGKGETINMADFMNLSIDRCIEAVKTMFLGVTDLDEREKQRAAEQLASELFDSCGKLDLSKCTKVGTSTGLQSLGFVDTKDKKSQSPDRGYYESSDPPNPAPPHMRVQNFQRKIEPKNDEEDHINESPQERVEIDPGLWVQYANEEVQKGRVANDIREKGMDTIICVDVSQSMRGDAWHQATTFIKSFVEGIQNSTLMDKAYEHVALTTYGSETRVQQHLTCDYVEIIRKLNRLKPSGPSPMYAGLQMVHAAVIGAGAIFVSNGYKMHPRVFLITDGKPTPASLLAGPDERTASWSHKDELAIILLVKEMADKFHVTVNPVPVGAFDLDIIEKIANVSKGKIISPEDWSMQSRVFKNNLAAAKAAGGPLKEFLAPGLAKLTLESVSFDASPEDLEQMDEFLRTHKPDSDDESDNLEIDHFPPLGSRVRRHKSEASLMTQSKHEIGTVTKHMSDGHIGITWDEPNSHGTIREKIMYVNGMKGVTRVDTPRILHDEMIAEGCRVKRGRDWHYDDQDGGDGNLGNVFMVTPNGIVKVRWDNGHKNTYMFGAGGKFDLELIGQNKEGKKKEDKTKSEYMIPSDEESEERRVQEMNKKNRVIYDLMESTQSEVEGATAPPTEKIDRLKAKAIDKKKDSISEIKSKCEKALKNVEPVNKKQTEKSTAFASRDLDKLNRRNAADASVSSVQNGQGDSGSSVKKNTANKGANPKADLIKHSGPKEAQMVQWMWQDGNTWKEYPPEVCEKIEIDFKRNPRGTTLIRLNDIPFRVVFPRMELVNIETKDKFAVQRNA